MLVRCVQLANLLQVVPWQAVQYVQKDNFKIQMQLLNTIVRVVVVVVVVVENL